MAKELSRAKSELEFPTVQVWKPITLDHINVTDPDGRPMTFETKQSLKDYCKENKLQSGALL